MIYTASHKPMACREKVLHASAVAVSYEKTVSEM